MNLARILDEGKEVPEHSLVTGNIEGENNLVTDNNNDRLQKLDSKDRSAAIDALITAISMKQIAISKESKKRSQVDTTTIASWQKEIESLERTVCRRQRYASADLKSI